MLVSHSWCEETANDILYEFVEEHSINDKIYLIDVEQEDIDEREEKQSIS